MSGTAFGTIVLHITPEFAVGGPLALVRNGDMIRLDVAKRSIDLLVDDAELEKRRAALAPAVTPDWAKRGYAHLFNETILQADEGCDFDFMREAGRRARALGGSVSPRDSGGACTCHFDLLVNFFTAMRKSSVCMASMIPFSSASSCCLVGVTAAW